MSTKQVLQLLRDYESQNITFIEPDGSWPVVWERASGMHVWDAEGKKYLDLTAAFGVAAAGHANRNVMKAGRDQLARLPHAMGDVHPHALKARLARELSRVTFERWGAPTHSGKGKTIFCSSGFEAVEAGLKTALLATGKPGVLAFEGAYHGLGYGTLNATHRPHFHAPFQQQLARFGRFVPFPQKDIGSDGISRVEDAIRALLGRQKIGAILVEPVQVRGGINIPDVAFLKRLRALCDEFDCLLILDEIYTGFGRTGYWFACEASEVIPDIICLGKALTGGFPLSACVGKSGIMDAAWPPASGEAIHTSTFLGNPVGCAMAMANIREITRLKLPARSARLGALLLRLLQSISGARGKLRIAARGIGLLAGIELTTASGQPATEAALAAVKTLLHRGFIFLPEGEFSNVISFSPPLIINEAELRKAVKALEAALSDLA